MRWVWVLLIFSSAAACAERLDTAATVVLENDVLKVELYADRPAPLCYIHKPTGERMIGCTTDGVWRINGQDLPWARWRVIPFRRSDGTAAAYEMVLSGTPLRVQVRFVLRQNMLEMRLQNVHDPAGMLQTIEWIDMPLLVCCDAACTYWREVWRGAKWRPDARPVWRPQIGTGVIAASQPDPAARPTLHASVFSPKNLCAFVTSNCRLFPLLDRLVKISPDSDCAGAYALSLNAYYNCGEPLRARVVFLQDVNGDGACDMNDYALWMNRHLPEPPGDRLATALWYKLDDAAPEQTLDIMRRLSNLTGGLPQVCQLTGWRDRAGAATQLAGLAANAREFNAMISCQTRFSGVLPDPDPEGALASTGAAPDWRRLVPSPEENAPAFGLHLAAFRNSAGQTVPEQLYGGLLPLLDELSRHGVSVTAQNTGGLPVEMAGLFGALWRFEPPFELWPMYHGRMLAGLPPETARYALGHGCGIEIVKTADGEIDWLNLLDQVYLRAMLYHFYLEREWLDTEQMPNGAVRVTFSRDTTTAAGPAPDDIRVVAAGMTVADGTDRFIPRGDAIYAYSRDGTSRSWKLPQNWAGQALQVTTLTADGPQPPQEVKNRQGRIRIHLAPRTPTIITRLPDQS